MDSVCLEETGLRKQRPFWHHSMPSCRTWSMSGYWNQGANVPPTGRRWTILKDFPAGSMTSTAPWMSLLKNATSSNRKPLIPLAFSVFPGNHPVLSGWGKDCRGSRIRWAVCRMYRPSGWRCGPILKVSEGRWQIEECFRIMKTDFEARPAFVRLENWIKAHFLTCFPAFLVYRILEIKLGGSYTCEEILRTLKEMNFADIEDQGYIPLYRRSKLTDALHDNTCC